MARKPFSDINGNPIEEGDLLLFRTGLGHGPRVLAYGIVGLYHSEQDIYEIKSAQVDIKLSRRRQVINLSKMK